MFTDQVQNEDPLVIRNQALTEGTGWRVIWAYTSSVSVSAYKIKHKKVEITIHCEIQPYELGCWVRKMKI